MLRTAESACILLKSLYTAVLHNCKLNLSESALFRLCSFHFSFRVMFRRMIEKDIDQSIEKDVQRVCKWLLHLVKIAVDFVCLFEKDA